MGVHKLWQILEPTPLPVRLDTLSHKRLAVDASIWLYQFLKAMRSTTSGTSLPHSHIVGFFRRICKLLYFGIRPVFVFDGGVTRLKRDTVRKRRERRERGKEDAGKVARRLLGVELQRRQRELEKNPKQRKLEEGTSASVKHADDDEIEDESRFDRFRSTDEYHLPPIEGFRYHEDDSRINNESQVEPLIVRRSPTPQHQSEAQLENGQEPEEIDELEGIDLTTIDPASPEFAELPLTTQYLILSQLRLRSRLRMGYSKEQLEDIFPDSKDFSRFQIQMVQKRNYFTQRLMGMAGFESNEDITGFKRVAGEKDREYKLKKVEGGWSLSLEGDRGTSASNPVDLTKETKKKRKYGFEDEDDEIEWEDVDLDSKQVEPVRQNQSIGNLPLPPKIEDVNASESTMRSFMMTSPSKSKKGSGLKREVKPDDDFGYEQTQLREIEERELKQAIENSKKEWKNDLELEKAMIESTKNPKESVIQENANNVDENDDDDFGDFEDIPLDVLPPSTPTVNKKTTVPPISTIAPPPLFGSSVPVPKQQTINVSQPPPLLSSDRHRLEMDHLFGLYQDNDDSTETSKASDTEAKSGLPLPEFDFAYDDKPEKDKESSRIVSAQGLLLGIKPKPNVKDKDEISDKDTEDGEEKIIPSVPSWFDQPMQPLKSIASNLSKTHQIRKSSAGFINSIGSSLQERKRDEEIGLMSYFEAQEMLKKEKEVEKGEKFVDVIDISDDEKDVEVKKEDRDEVVEIEEDDEDGIIWENVETGEKEAEDESIEAENNNFSVIKEKESTEPEILENKEQATTSSPTQQKPMNEPEPEPEPLDYEFSEDEETDLTEQLAKEEETHLNFTQTLNPLIQKLPTEEETLALRESHHKSLRDSDTVTTDMIREVQELLTAFGIPYITAPTEAESQCAELLRLQLIDGIITDDSDVFLFGGDRVYRHFFAEKHYVEYYDVKSIKRELNLERQKFVELAILLGSDYTEGLKGVGPVSAKDILNHFRDLGEFRDWFLAGQLDLNIQNKETGFEKQLRRKLTKSEIIIDESFPDPEIINAYLQPEVDSDPTKFVWGEPELDKVREFMMTTANWSREKCDQVLIPLIRDLNKKKAEKSKQGTLGEFYDVEVLRGARGAQRKGQKKTDGKRKTTAKKQKQHQKKADDE